MKIFDSDPKNFDALYILGKSYEGLKDINKALFFIEQANAVKKSEIVQIFLGQLYSKNNQLKKATKVFKNMLNQYKDDESNPNFIRALIELGTSLGMSGNYEKAKKYFKHAIKLDENNIVANFRLGKILLKKTLEFDKAAECYRRILMIDQSNAKALSYIAEIYLEKK